jgi:two-component system, OmpR family, sensor histidine kinase KdpD
MSKTAGMIKRPNPKTYQRCILTSPDLLYPQITRRGKHKIFIGMARGVGKIYKMPEEAHLLKQEGIDDVIGVLETHGRKG